MGEITDYTGKLTLGHNVQIGYFAQNQAQLLDESLTVFDTIDRVAVGDIRLKIRDILGAFMFGGEASDKKVKVLSGGERTRLAMIKLLLERVNLSLLRRLVRTDTLVQEAAQAHTCCNTEYALCYCKDRADPAMVRRVRAILQSARPELLLDSSYFVPWLLPGKARLFTPVHYTERPAVAAAKLCEGKLVILVNGSPSALVLPALFSEQFECLDDYASTAAFSSFLRVLKYFSFYLTVFLPGVFVCVAVYLPELLPPQLLYKIEAAEKATPLPLFAEMLLVILILEIIREAGLRMPQSLGHSVSLVSALIIGDAAIATGLMSTPVIFVASITAIAVFVTPGLYEPATLLRIGTVLLAGLAGPVGLAAAFFGFLLSIVSTEALGVPYLAPHPFPQHPLSDDGVLRRNYRQLSRHGFNIWQKRERGKRQT